MRLKRGTKRVAEGFKIAGHAEGEFLPRSSLRNFLSPKGRIDEADAQMDRIAEISVRSAIPF